MRAVVTSKGGWQRGKSGFPTHSKISEGFHIDRREGCAPKQSFFLEINNFFKEAVK